MGMDMSIDTAEEDPREKVEMDMSIDTAEEEQRDQKNKFLFSYWTNLTWWLT